MLRRIAERFSRGRILKRHLPKEFDRRFIYVSPDAALRFWRHDLATVDPALFALVRKVVKPTNRVWDVGANVGLFSFAASAVSGLAGSVLSIEPDPFLTELLRKSAEPFPHHAPVTVLSVAVADKQGLVEFNVARRGRCSNFVSGFGTLQGNGPRSSFPQIAVTLDWLAEYFPLPDVLKVDVEGMEHLVLRGAQSILKSSRVVIVEAQEQNRQEITDTLIQFGYHLEPSGSGNNLLALK